LAPSVFWLTLPGLSRVPALCTEKYRPTTVATTSAPPIVARTHNGNRPADDALAYFRLAVVPFLIDLAVAFGLLAFSCWVWWVSLKSSLCFRTLAGSAGLS